MEVGDVAAARESRFDRRKRGQLQRMPSPRRAFAKRDISGDDAVREFVSIRRGAQMGADPDDCERFRVLSTTMARGGFRFAIGARCGSWMGLLD